MNYMVFYGADMDEAQASEWIDIHDNKKARDKIYIQTAWDNLAGDKDGVVTIYGTTDTTETPAFYEVLAQYTTTADNMTNCEGLTIDSAIRRVKVDYDEGGNTDGELYCVLQTTGGI